MLARCDDRVFDMGATAKLAGLYDVAHNLGALEEGGFR